VGPRRRGVVGDDGDRRTRLVRRGEIRWVVLDPMVGSESNRRRPAVIVSNDGANGTAERLGRGVVTVVPVTSNIARIYPFQVALSAAETGLEHDSKAQAEQVRSIAVQRIGSRIGDLPTNLLAELDEALRLHLAL
jgi:mRNA interferase MazF